MPLNDSRTPLHTACLRGLDVFVHIALAGKGVCNAECGPPLRMSSAFSGAIACDARKVRSGSAVSALRVEYGAIPLT